MALRPVQSDPFDDLLREAAEAHRAGIFGSTPLDVDALMARPVAAPAPRLYRWALAGLPLAACLALFVALAAFWQAGAPTSRGPRNMNDSFSRGVSDGAERCQTLENLRACFSGPGLLVRTDCRCVDFDADGDVDLRDVSQFKMDSAGQ